MIARAVPPILLLTLLLAAAGCSARRGAREVVVYTSLDRPYAQPIAAAFERDTGIRVILHTDTEAEKSLGLANLLRAERGRPRADVFWSSEAVRLIQLARQGLLAPYPSRHRAAYPAMFRDRQGYWTGFAARARVIAYVPGRVHPPRDFLALSTPAYRGQVVMANPRFGTTATEVAALFQVWGKERATAFYRALRANQVQVVDGNSAAAEAVARRRALLGLTDTDDAYTRMDRGARLQVLFPQHGRGGTLLIPNTVGLVAGAPHPEEGRRFIDYLLSPETELRLANLPSRQVPLHPEARRRAPARVRPLLAVRPLPVDYARLAEQMEAVDRFLREEFER
ncbi:MAG: extracellular solute-binding protein [Armatimonadetes bacterium]|nr:extracellular solute-binding protein [Armatimonadota bacterium]